MKRLCNFPSAKDKGGSAAYRDIPIVPRDIREKPNHHERAVEKSCICIFLSS